jgi:hypothetical protein
MAETQRYGFNKPVSTEPIYPNGIENLETGFDEIDAKIYELDNQNIKKSTVTAKGDLLIGTANATVGRLGIGTDDQVLKSDATGVPVWGDLPIAMVLTGDTEPEANEGNRGKLFIKFNVADTADQIFVCLKGADNLYTWQEVTFTV